jgi:hypothetical protein
MGLDGVTSDKMHPAQRRGLHGELAVFTSCGEEDFDAAKFGLHDYAES